MANVKDDEFETLEFADESEYMEDASQCLDCDGEGCESCDGTGDEPAAKRPDYRLNPS